MRARCASAAPGRAAADEVTVFDSVGFALEDYAALRWLYAAAHARRAGRAVELVAMPPDPRNLYGWMMAQAEGREAGLEPQRLASLA